MSRTLHHPHRALSHADGPVLLDPLTAGWTYTSLRVIELAPGVPFTLPAAPLEVCLLPLSAQKLTVRAAGQEFAVDGRAGVFARVSDFVYVGRDTTVEITSETGGEVAVTGSRCDNSLPPKYGPAEDVAVEVRGGGQATRQITRADATSHIPVVIVSSKDQDADKVWGQRQGACGYLTKPVDDRTLINTVNGLLG